MRAKETRWGAVDIAFVAFVAFVVAEALRDAANRGPSELVADAILARTSNAPRHNLTNTFRGLEDPTVGAGRYRGR
jgi:hypothetical protein